MIYKGVKNDDGLLFEDLTDEQIKEQIDLWVLNNELQGVTLRQQFNKTQNLIDEKI